ncbi:MAG: hypothetical protein M1822_007434 [Bathelium mastoideum]|nr:MAG: hypothetical protein M1822_007434 [Bathelium mastoideum]
METSGAVASIVRLFNVITPLSDRAELRLLLRENFLNPLSWQFLSRADIPQVTHRIRRYVLNGDSMEAWRLKESYKDTFALQAVSAAIIAQIAITMPGLSYFGNIHWTATAFAYTSLVSGILSTFFAFFVQQILSDLHSPEDVREWLTSPRKPFTNRFIDSIFPQNGSEGVPERAANQGNRIPSITAAATLTAPRELLAFSIITLFISLGIYLGSVYTAKLGTLEGSNANLAVLLFFIIFSILAFALVYIPVNYKRMEQISVSLINKNARGLPLEELDDGRHNNEVATAVAPGATSETQDAIREALVMSIRAQEESLRAQRAFLSLLDRVSA